MPDEGEEARCSRTARSQRYKHVARSRRSRLTGADAYVKRHFRRTYLEGRNSFVCSVRLARLVDAEVVDATKQRTGKARALRDPPHVAHPAIPAVQHLSADVVHHQGTHLNRRIERGVPREWLEHWIQFLCASRRDGASRRPGVKSGGAVCRDSKSHPKRSFLGSSPSNWPNGTGIWLAGFRKS